MHFQIAKSFFVILIFSFAAVSAKAASQMIGVGSDTPVYPRPSLRYRPIFDLKVDHSIRVSDKIVKTDELNYYKVLLFYPNGKRVIGYVPETANVKIKTDKMDDDDFENYSELALSSSSISSSLGYFRGSNYMVTLGYQHYISPGFYLKYYFGEWFSPNGGGDHFGLEMGNDTLVSRQISLLYAFSFGPILPAQDNGIFLASQANGMNYLLRGLLGIRLNQGGRVSFGLAGVESVLFNNNSSFTTFGGQLSLEVGI